MNLLLVFLGILVASLLGLLVWAVGSGAARKPNASKQGTTELCLACKHVINLPQIRQALAQADFEYIQKKSKAETAKRVRKERRRIALRYLEGLREDFEQLMHAAQIVASLSPEVEAKEEWKRFRLSLAFRLKYQLARTKFAIGIPSFSGVQDLAQVVSSFAVALERAVREIGIAAMGATAPLSTQS